LAEGAVIGNRDPDVQFPDAEVLAGTSFIRPIYSELDTRLQFGVKDAVLAEIILTPTKYTISDPMFTDEGGEIYPQAPPEIVTPPHPSDERVVDGPSDDGTQEEGTEENDVET